MEWRVISRKTILFLFLLWMCVEGVLSCSEPIAGRNLIEAGLDGDIVFAVPANGNQQRWEILSAQANKIDLRSHFLLRNEGPFTYLLVVKGIQRPQGAKKYWKISIKLVCTGSKEKKVYTTEAKVISAKSLQKIQLTVPENTTIGTTVYSYKTPLSVQSKAFRTFPTKNESVDANRFFSLNPETGAISLDSKLDYESDNKLMMMITVEKDQDRRAKIIIFWIKVTNINDNHPEIFLNKCPMNEMCKAKSYVIEATQSGVLYIYNESTLGARDKDGDEINFLINKVKPKDFDEACSINRSTGILTLENIVSLPNNTRFYITVQASDGEFLDTVSITIKVRKPPKKLLQHEMNEEKNSNNSSKLISDDLFEITKPKSDLIDLPAWFFGEEEITLNKNNASAVNQSTSDNNEKEHVMRIRDECSSSKLVASMSFSELSAILSNVNETAIEEFCNTTQAKKESLAGNSKDVDMFDEILTFCRILPQNALTLFDFKGHITNKTKLIQFCRNSTVEHWLKGKMREDGMRIAMMKTSGATHPFSPSTWSIILSVMFSFTRWVLEFHF